VVAELIPLTRRYNGDTVALRRFIDEIEASLGADSMHARAKQDGEEAAGVILAPAEYDAAPTEVGAPPDVQQTALVAQPMASPVVADAVSANRSGRFAFALLILLGLTAAAYLASRSCAPRAIVEAPAAAHLASPLPQVYELPLPRSNAESIELATPAAPDSVSAIRHHRHKSAAMRGSSRPVHADDGNSPDPLLD
jgi:hypothetical protein